MRDVSLSTRRHTTEESLLGPRFWRHIQHALGYLGMFAVVLIVGIPVAWVLSGALKTNREIFSTTPNSCRPIRISTTLLRLGKLRRLTAST